MITFRRRYLVMAGTIGIGLIVALTFGLVMGLNNDTHSARKFTVDHTENIFRLNGKPFRYVSGSIHYFRILPDAWQKRLRTMRAAGLNAIDTYVEWSLHNPTDGVYKWDDIANIEHFIELARNEGFYIILRPGPYICAERDNGGLPYWLFKKYPNIKLRTSDKNYLNEVRIWYEKLMPRLQKYLYGNGGPIIMVQVENEYGVYHACDEIYLHWLRDETKKYVDDKALLFTTDIPNDRIKCGKINGVFATTDFGLDRIHEIDKIWSILREVQPTGPLVNSEFYPGWLTHWQEANQRRNAVLVANSLSKILESNASVNFYMFHGGTNFGFTAGANDFGYNFYNPDITSYDYDAVLDEAGGITKKFELISTILKDILPQQLPEIPTPTKRLSYGQIEMTPIANMFAQETIKILAQGKVITTSKPLTFEELDLYSGLVLYETKLPKFEIDPTLLTVEDLRDRAFVLIDQQLIGVLSRENRIYSLPLSNGWGDTLQLLVENQGRINFNVTNDTKGIFGNITIQKLNGERKNLRNWTTTALPLNEESIIKVVEQFKAKALKSSIESMKKGILQNGPIIYYGEFNVADIGDTYLNTIGWGKGVAYVNNFNLGRYWPLAGPQLTLYVPNELLKIGVNTLVLIEYQRAKVMEDGLKASIQLDDKARLDSD